MSAGGNGRENPKCMIFVGNLPRDWSIAQLHGQLVQKFKPFGEIVYCNVTEVNWQAVAFVLFRTESEAKAAIERADKHLGPCILSIQPKTPKKTNRLQSPPSARSSSVAAASVSILPRAPAPAHQPRLAPPHTPPAARQQQAWQTTMAPAQAFNASKTSFGPEFVAVVDAQPPVWARDYDASRRASVASSSSSCSSSASSSSLSPPPALRDEQKTTSVTSALNALDSFEAALVHLFIKLPRDNKLSLMSSTLQSMTQESAGSVKNIGQSSWSLFSHNE